jgi:FMN phosphatase YigB (HAD superfamily)
MKIFIDFDDVIFNTKKLKEDLINIYSRGGVSKKQFMETYLDFPKERKGIIFRIYDPYDQMKKIRNSLGIDTQGIERDFLKIVSQARKYIFKDTTEFLKKFKRNDLYILSYGDNKFQRNKIKNSGVRGYFKKVIITDKMKSFSILETIKKEKINKKDKIYFIDDREKFISDVKNNIPGAVTILIRRKEGRYSDPKTKFCDYAIKNLKEAEKIIKN